MSDNKVWIGIDVASDHLDVAVGHGKPWQVGNDDGGSAELIERIGKLSVERVVIEATGGYEQAVAAALVAAGISVAIVNPRQVRDFAKATGQLAKPDALDARVLVAFGEAIRPRPTALHDAERALLAGLVDRRRQLIGMRIAENHRVRTAVATVQAQLREHVAWLDAQIKALDRQIAKLLKSQVLEAKADLLTSVPGVGATTAAALMPTCRSSTR